MKNSKIFSLAKLMLLFIVCLALALAMVSCGDDDSSDDNGGNNPGTTPSVPEGVACVHTYNDGVVQIAATCTNGGTTIKSCTKCGFETTVSTPKLAHNYEEKAIAATCTQAGSKTYTCKMCKDSYSDVSEPAKGHNVAGATWVAEDPVLQSGCTWMHIESTACKSCNETVEHISYFTKHTFSVAITTGATCVSDGTKTYTCSVCQETETESFSDVNAHAWGEGTVSATNASILNYACTNNGCSASKSVFSAKDQVQASVPAEALQSAGAVELQNATVKLDQSVLDQLKGNDITISADKVGGGDISDILDKMSEAEREKLNSTTVFDFTLNQGENAISQFDGKVTVTVPYTLEPGADPDNIAVWYIKEDGSLDAIEATYTVINGEGFAMFETNHFSYYSVVRMSPEERCALYGHKYNVEVVEAACNQEGYSIKTCKYCKKVEPRYDFTPALSHNYENSVVAPTCNSKGYTLSKCSLCKDSYNSNYVDQLTHKYVKTVINPTCKASGYTLNKCSLCDDSFKENELGIIDHKYASGKCTMCGKAQQSAGNAFLTMVDSLANAESFLFEANNFVFTGLVDGVDVTYVLNKLKAYVKITADGLLEGEGVASATATYKEDGDEETMSSDAKILFKDGNIYMYTNNADNMIGSSLESDHPNHSYPNVDGGPIFNYGNSYEDVIRYPDDITYDLFAVVSQSGLIDMVLDEMDVSLNEEMSATVEKAFDDLLGIWNSILDAKNSPIEAAIERLVNLLFTKKEVNGGYTYTFNPTFAKVVLDSLEKDSFDKIFDSMFGKGSYASAIEFANRAIDMTIPAIKAELEGELAKSGIVAATIYALISEYTNGQIDVDAMVNEQFSEIKLYELINNMTGNTEGTVDSYREYITQVDTMMKESTAITIYEQFLGEYPTDNRYEDMLDEIIDIIDNIVYSFTTTKDGEFLSFALNFNKFEFDKEIEGDQVKFTANGSFSFSINTSNSSDNYDQLIKDTTTLEEAVKPSENVYTNEFAIITHNGIRYIIFYNPNTTGNIGSGGSITITPKPKSGSVAYDKEIHFDSAVGSSSTIVGNIHGSTAVSPSYKPSIDYIYTEGEIDYIYELLYGKTVSFTITEELGSENSLRKVKAIISNFYVVDDSSFIYGAHSCEGWIRVGAQVKAYRMGAEATEGILWLDEEGKIKDMEITSDLDNIYYSTSSVDFYYAPATKEYKLTPSHNFKIVEDVRPNGCNYGIRTFRCTLCGAEQRNEYGKGHTWEQVAVLDNGSVTCEDGVTIKRRCADCGEYDDYSWTTDNHYTVRTTRYFEGTTECRGISAVYEICACGKVGNFIGTISDHAMMSYTWENDSNNVAWMVFRCSVEDCGFSYKYRYNSGYSYDPSNPEGTCWYSQFEEAVICGETLRFDREKSLSHDLRGTTNEITTDNIRKTIWTCTLCKVDIEEDRHEILSFGDGSTHSRQIYSKNLLTGKGWRREFTGCDYKQYDLITGEFLYDGTEHAMRWETIIHTSCSQYGLERVYCMACNYEEGYHYYSPYDYYWYGGMNNSHDWYYTGEGTYCCYRCGTESTYGASGFITLEDMTDTGNFWVGYYNGLILDVTDIEIYFNYVPEVSGDLLENSASYFENENTTPYEYHDYDNRNSGIIKVDMDALNSAIAEHGNVETVSVVFSLLLESQVEEGESFVQMYALTFTLDELAKLN